MWFSNSPSPLGPRCQTGQATATEKKEERESERVHADEKKRRGRTHLFQPADGEGFLGTMCVEGWRLEEVEEELVHYPQVRPRFLQDRLVLLRIVRRPCWVDSWGQRPKEIDLYLLCSEMSFILSTNKR